LLWAAFFEQAGINIIGGSNRGLVASGLNIGLLNGGGRKVESKELRPFVASFCTQITPN